MGLLLNLINQFTQPGALQGQGSHGKGQPGEEADAAEFDALLMQVLGQAMPAEAKPEPLPIISDTTLQRELSVTDQTDTVLYGSTKDNSEVVSKGLSTGLPQTALTTTIMGQSASVGQFQVLANPMPIQTPQPDEGTPVNSAEPPIQRSAQQTLQTPAVSVDSPVTSADVQKTALTDVQKAVPTQVNQQIASEAPAEGLSNATEALATQTLQAPQTDTRMKLSDEANVQIEPTPLIENNPKLIASHQTGLEIPESKKPEPNSTKPTVETSASATEQSSPVTGFQPDLQTVSSLIQPSLQQTPVRSASLNTSTEAPSASRTSEPIDTKLPEAFVSPIRLSGGVILPVSPKSSTAEDATTFKDLVQGNVSDNAEHPLPTEATPIQFGREKAPDKTLISENLVTQLEALPTEAIESVVIHTEQSNTTDPTKGKETTDIQSSKIDHRAENNNSDPSVKTAAAPVQHLPLNEKHSAQPELPVSSHHMAQPATEMLINKPTEKPVSFNAIPHVPAEQVAEGAIDAIRSHRSEITLQLRPESLGQVTVNLSSNQQQQVSARLVAFTPEAHQALTEQVQTLRQSLESHGIQVDRISISLASNAVATTDSSQNNAGFQQGGQFDGQSDGNRHQTGHHAFQHQHQSHQAQQFFQQFQQQQGQLHHQSAARLNPITPVESSTSIDTAPVTQGRNENGKVSVLA